MTTNKTDSVCSVTISSWLADLHMECYKKNLEEYENIKPLLDLRDSDIKKLGVGNSKDRSRMMNSLALYKGLRQQEVAMTTGGGSAPPPPVTGQLTQVSQDSHKSLLRKGSLRKLNFKSFLTSGNSKKNKGSKKATDLSVQMGGASMGAPTSESEDPSTSNPPPQPPPPPVAAPPQAVVPQPPSSLPPPPSSSDENKTLSSSLADYEELPDVVSPLIRSMTVTSSKPFQVPSHQSAVENEYVPSPENSPKFNSSRPRANTVGTPMPYSQDHAYSLTAQQRANLMHHTHSVNSTPELMLRNQNQMEHLPEEDSPGHLTHKHLSVVSMESGLSFGYDVEKDFNPSNPLESQPWFHGRVLRNDAENMLHYDGDFLVRENTTMSNTYTLTLRWRGVADHTLIGTTEVISSSGFSARGSAVKYQFDSGAFDSIPELIYNHLKYQIPIDRTQHTLITNPICRPGNALKGGMYAALGVYVPISRATLSPESSPSITMATTKRRSGSPPDAAAKQQSQRRLGRPISISPHNSPRDTPPRLSKHLSTSSGNLLESQKEEVDVAHRNVISPPPDTRNRAMTVSHFGPRPSSSGPLCNKSSNPPSQPSPPDVNNHQRVDSFGDYEMMESVSILGDSPSLGARKLNQPPTDQQGYLGNNPASSAHNLPQQRSSGQLGHHGSDPSRNLPHQRSCEQLLGGQYQHHQSHHGSDFYSRSQSVSAGNTLNRLPRGDVKYAEIRCNKSGGNGPTNIRSGSNTINYADVRLGNSRPNSGNARSVSNYAEVRFSRSNTISSAAHQPHPYTLYDTVPSGRREATHPSQQDASPYHSRADVLAQRLQVQVDPTYSIPKPSASKRATSRHPISNYVTIQFSDQDTHPSTVSRAPDSSPDTPAHIPIKNTDPVLYAQPDKSRLNSRTRELSSSNDSLLSGGSGSHASGSHASGSHSNSPAPSKHVIGSSLLHSHTPSAKVHRSLPGYEALVKAHTILQNHSSDELAYHMTRTDAVSFMLAPRPGEDQGVWRDRVKHVTSTSGAFCGLQTLADPDGEKLWKKLYFRHLNLSQIVTLTVVTAGDALERTKLLHRYIEVAQLLQSQRYGNLFSFIAVMQGLAAPQLVEMSDLWSLLENHFPREAATYKTLKETLASIDQGKAFLSTDHLVIPPIQHLKPIFHFNDQSMIGFAPVRHDHSVVGEYTDMTTALEFMHTIVSGSVQFTVNAWKQLEGLQYNVTLMEFLTQDYTRVYLQSINVHSDDPMERRRRFGLLMDALIDRVESNESV